MKKNYIFKVLLVLNGFYCFAFPELTVQLNVNDFPHYLVAEKESYKIHLFENRKNFGSVHISSFPLLIGKNKGDKRREGDKKTPEGVFFLKEFHSAKKLRKWYGPYAKIYGAGAFPISYPNNFDKFRKKTGGGIWLHSVEKDTRVDLKNDTRGCLAIKENDLLTIQNFIEIGKTPIIVVSKLKWKRKISNHLLPRITSRKPGSTPRKTSLIILGDHINFLEIDSKKRLKIKHYVKNNKNDLKPLGEQTLPFQKNLYKKTGNSYHYIKPNWKDLIANEHSITEK